MGDRHAERTPAHRRNDVRQHLPCVRQAHGETALDRPPPRRRQRDAVDLHGERPAVHRHRLRRRQERRAQRWDVRGVCIAVIVIPSQMSSRAVARDLLLARARSRSCPIWSRPRCSRALLLISPNKKQHPLRGYPLVALLLGMTFTVFVRLRPCCARVRPRQRCCVPSETLITPDSHDRIDSRRPARDEQTRA